MQKEPTYFALLEDEQTVIFKSSLDLIKAIQEPIKFIVKCEYNSQVEWGMNKATLYAYTAVDINGSPKPIELSNFVFVDLGTDWAGRYVNQRLILVKEKHTGKIREFPSNSAGKDFLLYNIMPLVRQLNNAGSWETLDKYKELDDVKVENGKLKERIQSLESEVHSLKATLVK